ncbi:MAG: CoA transferase, partial [Sphingopyxis sp.]
MPALSGLRIIDFSRFLPGAYGSWVAADMGADVIRVEHPRELAKQAAMATPPAPGNGADGGDGGDGGGGRADDGAARQRARPSYMRNKRSIAINPGVPASRAVLAPLIASADVVIEDYRPGVMAAMGYGAEALCAAHPRLIYLSVSFAGQTGPLAGAVGHDPAALALAGALAGLNGTTTPTLPGLQVADTLAGAHAT